MMKSGVVEILQQIAFRSENAATFHFECAAFIPGGN